MTAGGLLDDFFVRAIVAGIGVAAVAGPLGCFVVWRQMAYFGDTMAHSALLGVALGLLIEVRPIFGVVAVTALIALLLSVLRLRALSSDTVLGILSHSALSLGLVAVGLMTWLRLDLMGYLFGDILAVTAADVGWIYAGGSLALAALVALWRPLLAATVDEDLAQAEGVAVRRVNLALLLLIALIIALAMKVVGILLITSLLIIPAASARQFAHSPEQMALGAAVVGAVAVVAGLSGSLAFDTPAGPSIVVAAAALFAASLVPLRRKA